jgi:hypothetical protein
LHKKVLDIYRSRPKMGTVAATHNELRTSDS